MGRYFGEINGYPEGSWFESRIGLSQARVHCPLQAGISGSGSDGADSIVISGGYEDDSDKGDTIVYTGQGGRDLNTGGQIADQELTRGNAGLALSKERGYPVRVIRGSQAKSKFSPAKGYRYDGLFRVIDCWQESGASGFKIWKFKLEKIQGTSGLTAKNLDFSEKSSVLYVSKNDASNQGSEKVLPRLVMEKSNSYKANFQLPESFDEIENKLTTIQQYRDYYHPDSPLWPEYINEIFHVLGFQTEHLEPRLLSLSNIGIGQLPKALVLFINPGENFEELVPGIKWETHLCYAVEHHNLGWGIITNGLQLKVISVQNGSCKVISTWTDLDSIITDHKLDSFLPVYKQLMTIKQMVGETITSDKVAVHNLNSGMSTDVIDPSRTLINNIQYRQNQNWEDTIPPSLQRLLQVYKEMSLNGLDFEKACLKTSNQARISVQTVRIDCSAKLHIRIDAFGSLIRDRQKLITTLKRCYPKCQEAIDKLF